MNAGQTVFRQLLQFFPRHEFNLCGRRYHGEGCVWEQVPISSTESTCSELIAVSRVRTKLTD